MHKFLREIDLDLTQHKGSKILHEYIKLFSRLHVTEIITLLNGVDFCSDFFGIFHLSAFSHYCWVAKLNNFLIVDSQYASFQIVICIIKNPKVKLRLLEKLFIIVSNRNWERCIKFKINLLSRSL